MCLNTGTPNNCYFSIWHIWKINGFSCVSDNPFATFCLSLLTQGTISSYSAETDNTYYNNLSDLFIISTVMCLSIGTPKTINFPFVPNFKLIILKCPKIWAHCSLIIMG